MARGRRGGKRGGRRAGRRRGARGGFRTAVKAVRTTDFASCVDTVAEFDASANNVYTLYNIALTNSARAKAIAAAYQLFRIKKVTVVWKPVIDTYVGTSSVPTLYYMIDKANTLTNVDLAGLKMAGAKPHTLNERLLSTSFAPAVRTAGPNAVGGTVTVDQSGPVRVSPWLSTNNNAGNFPLPSLDWTPNGVDHGGLAFAMEQRISGTPAAATVEIRIHYEFKKAIWSKMATGPGPIPIDLDPKPEPVQSLS